MTPLNLDQVRAEFPALQSGTVYLDNAGGSQVLRRVADRVHDYLLTSSVHHGAQGARAQAACGKITEARRSVARLINAPHDDEVVLGSATTSLLFLLTQALLDDITPGDEIIVTDCDHEANIGGWLSLQRAGAVIRFWHLNPETLSLELADLDRLLTRRTRWVAMTQASNVLGTVNPVDEVAKRVHAVGGRLCVDAAAYAPHRLVDVQQSGADVCLLSFYKMFGPHHAVMWGRREMLLSLPSLNHFFIGRDALPGKLQPGNASYELSYGCIGISDYLIDIGSAVGASGSARQHMRAAFEAFERHEGLLAERLLASLRGRRNLRVIGLDHVNGRRRLPIVSFTVDGRRCEDIVRHVDRFDIGIRFGSFDAQRLITALDLEAAGGVVRVSMAHYNTLEEIDRLVVHLDEAIGPRLTPRRRPVRAAPPVPATPAAPAAL